MKKFLIFLFIGFGFLSIFSIQPVKADEFYNKLTENIKQLITENISFYKNLNSCRSYTSQIYGVKYEIFGLSNNQCHFKIGASECYMPKESYKKFSSLNVKYGERTIKEIDKKEFSLSNRGPDTEEINNMMRTYCKMK